MNESRCEDCKVKTRELFEVSTSSGTVLKCLNCAGFKHNKKGITKKTAEIDPNRYRGGFW